MRPADAPVSFRGVLTYFPDFRRVFFSRAISLFGDWLNFMALLTLLGSRTGGANPRELAFLFISKLLPLFVASIPAGIVADRFRRRDIIIVADFARFLVVGSIFLVIALPDFTAPIIYTATALQIVGGAFAEAARSASIPNLVSPAHLTAANALLAAVWSTMYVSGIMAGGLLTTWIGWQGTLVADLATYLLSAFFIYRSTIPQYTRQEAPPGGSDPSMPDKTGNEKAGPPPFWVSLTRRVKNDFAQTARFLSGNHKIALIYFMKSGWALAGGMGLVIYLLARDFDYGLEESMAVSVLFASRALGTGLGPWLAQFLSGSEPNRLRLVAYSGYFLAALSYTLLAILWNPWISLFLIFVAHVGGSAIWVGSSIILQTLVPDHIRGRILATELGLATLVLSFSLFGFGELAFFLPVPHLVFTLAGLQIIAGITMVWFGRPSRYARLREPAPGQ